ncbi:MAG TPA: GNAT family N-acetyltransferase [Bacilli bacterium]|nr:GNAT family N-acetyltransferase [Bacilli bacterium]
MSGEPRMLVEQDRAELMAFLEVEPYYGMFFMGNLLAMGMEHPNLDYWGLHRDGQLVAVMMRYIENWSVIASDRDQSLDLTWFRERLNLTHDVGRIMGKPWIVEFLQEGMPNHKPKRIFHDFFCSLKRENFQPGSTEGVFKLSLADQEAVHELYAGEEFAHITGETYRRRLVDSGCRAFALADPDGSGKLIAASMTTVETPTAAMVGSVFTKQTARGRGYGSRVTAALCAELLAQGKEACLFYDNPSAGVIYRRIGFQDIGFYDMIDFERTY